MKQVNILALFFTMWVVPRSISAAKTPVMIAELWRHGVRTAAYNTLHQKYVDGEGPGNLVGNGMRMHYLLGTQIRSSYKNSLFPDGTQPWNTSIVYSSSYDRTMMSAQAHMLGIFPKGTGQIISNSNSKTFTPPTPTPDVTVSGSFAMPEGARDILIKSIPLEEDDLFEKGFKNTCPALFNITQVEFKEKKVMFQPYVQDLATTIAAAYSPMEYFNKSSYDVETLGFMSDMSKCYYFNTGKLMDKIDQSTYDKLSWEIGLYYIAENFVNDTITKVQTTRMTNTILNTFDSKIKDPSYSNLKFLGFSGHEGNIIPYLMGWGLTSVECLAKGVAGTPVEGCEMSPAFAANIIWELSSENNAYFVRVLYNGKVVKNLCPQQDLSGYCTYDQFKQTMVEKFTMDQANIKTLCGSKPKPSSSTSTPGVFSNAWFYIAGILGIIVIVQLVGFIILTAQTKRNQPMDEPFEIGNSK